MSGHVNELTVLIIKQKLACNPETDVPFMLTPVQDRVSGSGDEC
uniref:Uncharacterized protein n=1 Tax=Anguilla anguilla TaxID=7936 RepID=A0A0E9RKR3_ANGAN